MAIGENVTFINYTMYKRAVSWLPGFQKLKMEYSQMKTTIAYNASLIQNYLLPIIQKLLMVSILYKCQKNLANPKINGVLTKKRAALATQKQHLNTTVWTLYGTFPFNWQTTFSVSYLHINLPFTQSWNLLPCWTIKSCVHTSKWPT